MIPPDHPHLTAESVLDVPGALCPMVAAGVFGGIRSCSRHDLRHDGGMADESSTVNDYMVALGAVVMSSATMEGCLREAFCSLVGSKFAAIVAGGQAVAWLIDQCEALTDAHRDLPELTRKAIRDALRNCREANGRRNDLVHGLKAPSEMGLETIRSRKNTYVVTSKEWGSPRSLQSTMRSR
jgi:hypothetical protein